MSDTTHLELRDTETALRDYVDTTRRYARNSVLAFPRTADYASAIEVYRSPSVKLRDWLLAIAIGVAVAALLFVGASS